MTKNYEICSILVYLDALSLQKNTSELIGVTFTWSIIEFTPQIS